MAQMSRTTRVGPRDREENALWLAVREVVPPGRAGLRTSYGEATGLTEAGSAPAGAFAIPRRRARAERFRGRPGARAAVVSMRVTEPGSQQAERPFGQQDADAPLARHEHRLRPVPRWARRQARKEEHSSAGAASSTGGRRGPARQLRTDLLQTQLRASRRPRRSRADGRGRGRARSWRDECDPRMVANVPPAVPTGPAVLQRQPPERAARPGAAEAGSPVSQAAAAAGRGSRSDPRSGECRGERTARSTRPRRSGRSWPRGRPPRPRCRSPRRSSRRGRG